MKEGEMLGNWDLEYDGRSENHSFQESKLRQQLLRSIESLLVGIWGEISPVQRFGSFSAFNDCAREKEELCVLTLWRTAEFRKA
jgi:hypothetical protein